MTMFIPALLISSALLIALLVVRWLGQRRGEQLQTPDPNVYSEGAIGEEAALDGPVTGRATRGAEPPA